MLFNSILRGTCDLRVWTLGTGAPRGLLPCSPGGLPPRETGMPMEGAALLLSGWLAGSYRAAEARRCLGRGWGQT